MVTRHDHNVKKDKEQAYIKFHFLSHFFSNMEIITQFFQPNEQYFVYLVYSQYLNTEEVLIQF